MAKRGKVVKHHGRRKQGSEKRRKTKRERNKRS